MNVGRLAHEDADAVEVVGGEVLAGKQAVGERGRHAASKLIGHPAAAGDDIFHCLIDGHRVALDVRH